jgi:hypothetical protein
MSLQLNIYATQMNETYSVSERKTTFVAVNASVFLGMRCCWCGMTVSSLCNFYNFKFLYCLKNTSIMIKRFTCTYEYILSSFHPIFCHRDGRTVHSIKNRVDTDSMHLLNCTKTLDSVFIFSSINNKVCLFV